MRHLLSVREIVSILMESNCYFRLKLEERHRLVKCLVASLPDRRGVYAGSDRTTGTISSSL